MIHRTSIPLGANPLQIEIGKLDKNGQRDMLRKLMRALNSGALQGNP